MLRLLRRTILALLLLAVAGAVALGIFSRSTPEWYAPPRPADLEVAELADRVEYRLMEEAQKVRPAEETWTLRVREAQVNAWLSSRLPEWIAHEQGVSWPDAIGTPQVRFEEGSAALAVPIGEGAYERVVVGRVAPSIRDGMLWVELTGVQVGRLSIPGDPLQTMLTLVQRASLDGRVDEAAWRHVIDLLSGREPIDPVLTLSDDRRVELLGVRCRAGAIELTSRTHGAGEVDPRWIPGAGERADEPTAAR